MASVWIRIRRQWRKLRVFLAGVLSFLHFLQESLRAFLYETTLPVTRRLLSRAPTPPKATVKDIRANRIRLNLESSFSSPFNVELFEIEWKPADIDTWTSIGFNDLQQRTVARLKPDTKYDFRVRAQNIKGISNWCGVVTAKTRLDPKDGGGYGPGYTWTQTPTDVVITFQVPSSVNKHDVKLLLKSDYLKVEVVKPPGHVGDWQAVLMDGALYGKVINFDNGSFWELIKEKGHTLVIITLEKAAKSLAPKFDYWRSIHPGHPDLEIDTHKITSEEAGTGMQMMQPGTMDPAQLQAMGLGQFAASGY